MKIEYKENCCSFCEYRNERVYWCGDEEIAGWVIGPNESTGDCYYLEDGCLNAIADDPWCGTGPLKINYCPMCGRKLNTKDEKDD